MLVVSPALIACSCAASHGVMYTYRGIHCIIYVLTVYNKYAYRHYGVNAAGDAGDTSPQYFGWGDVNGNTPPQYYYVLSDIADHYWLPSVRSASGRFHSAIRRQQFASVRQADSRLTRLVPQP